MLRKLALIALLAAAVTPASAAIVVYDNMGSFLTDSQATATAPIPFIGKQGLGPAVVGELTFTSGPNATTLFFDEWSDKIGDGGEIAEIAISEMEDLNVDLDAPVYSFGWEFVEVESDPNINGRNGEPGPFVESTFEVTLYLGAAMVDSFQFSRPNDQATFVGVWGDLPFDRVEIREIVGDLGNEFFGQFYTGGELLPEPATMSLLGLGGLALLRRRRR